MLPALFLIPLVALFRIWLAWQPAVVGASNWLLGFSPLAAVAPVRPGCSCRAGWRWRSRWVSCSSRTWSSTPTTARASSACPCWRATPCWRHWSAAGCSCAAGPGDARSPACSARRSPDRSSSTWPATCSLGRGRGGLPADPRRTVAGTHGRAARLSAELGFFPKRTCQRRALFYGVRRLRPPDRARAKGSLFLRAGRGLKRALFPSACGTGTIGPGKPRAGWFFRDPSARGRGTSEPVAFSHQPTAALP